MMQSHGASMRGPSRAPELQVVIMALHNARVIGGLSCTLQSADLDPMSTTESPWGSETAPGLALAAARHTSLQDALPYIFSGTARAYL